MENKVLSIIIPCYGKDNQVVDKSLDLVNKLLSKTNLIEVIFVYKNSEKYNYDWVKEKYSNFIVLKQERQDINKHHKQIQAIKMAHGKYFYTVDPDDLAKEENILNFLETLKKEENDLIVISHGIKLGEKEKHKRFIAKYKRNFGKVFFYNQVNIYKTEIVKHKSKDLLDYSDIFNKHSWFQDLLFPLWFLNKHSKMSFYNVELVDYVKGIGDSAQKNSFETDKYYNHLIDSYKVLEHFNESTSYNRLFTGTERFFFFCIWLSYNLNPYTKENINLFTDYYKKSSFKNKWIKLFFIRRIAPLILFITKPIVKKGVK